MLHTSEIPFISSEHGRERRTERDISIRDLQSAVKYGIKEIGYPGRLGEKRWKYTYADVVYITDGTSTKEITSWALQLPLTKVIIPDRYNASHLEAKSRIRDDASVITSHTVLIVDISGSMNKSDMNGHKTRARGAYYNLAMEFVASRLHPISSPFFGGPSASFSDFVTLIEMRYEPTIVFECEPLSWVLYNGFVHLAATSLASNHGNYYPSLKQAFDNLQNAQTLPTCALAMFFFSDGKPSDFSTTSNSNHDCISNSILKVVFDGCMLYKERLTFTAFGYGKTESEFDTMKQLCDAAKVAGSVSTFGYTYSDDSALSDILTSTATSITKTKTLLTCLDSGNGDRRVRNDKEKEAYDPQARMNAEDWTLFTKDSRSAFVKKYNLENLKENNFRATWKECPMLPDAAGIAVGNKYFGEGAERVLYLMSEINHKGEFIGPSLVAKESLFKHKKQDLDHLRKWHKSFVKSQRRAAVLAEKFNAYLDNKRVSKYIPCIKFLPCYVYECQTDDGDGQREFAYLSEKRLNPLNYKKWNNNCGGVDGQVKINQNIVAQFDLDNERTMSKKMEALKPFAEEDEDEEEDEEDGGNEEEKEEVINSVGLVAASRVTEIEKRILECDIPQAFTHFTHRHTNREQMVCDIQGELSVIDGYPVFELTDPCIHSQSLKFGNTDKGNKGFHEFFKTHQCNAVCELLGISSKILIDMWDL